MPRPIYEIANEIYWNMRALKGKAVRDGYPYAAPYLEAMFDLDRVSDIYGADSGKSVVLYFLANAASWKGEVARRIKAELKEIVK